MALIYLLDTVKMLLSLYFEMPVPHFFSSSHIFTFIFNSCEYDFLEIHVLITIDKLILSLSYLPSVQWKNSKSTSGKRNQHLV